MAGPTLLEYVESNYADTTGVSTETTGTLDWNAAGNIVVLLGATEDNSHTFSSGPTATGLTFSGLSGSPTNTGSSCKGYAWSATASGSGSSTVTAGHTISVAAGISAWAFSGATALGTPAINVGSGRTVSVTVGVANSTVVMILADWNATTDVTFTTVPSGGTVREATSVSGRCTFVVIEWTNQAAGTRSYGADTDWTGTGTITKIAVEVRGSHDVDGTRTTTANRTGTAALSMAATGTRATTANRTGAAGLSMGVAGTRATTATLAGAAGLSHSAAGTRAVTATLAGEAEVLTPFPHDPRALSVAFAFGSSQAEDPTGLSYTTVSPGD